MNKKKFLRHKGSKSDKDDNSDVNSQVGTQNDDKISEYFGGNNCTPRTFATNDAGFVYDPVPYIKKSYKGSDDFVKSRFNLGMLRNKSLVSVRNKEDHDAINNDFNKRTVYKHGKSYVVNNYWPNRYGPYDPETEEPPLGPQEDIERESA